MEPTTELKTDLQSIEDFLSKYEGGSIYLSKEYFDEGIAFIHIRNQRKKNAIGGKMMVDFRNCVLELESWREGKAVILCGDGENFSSGGDLDFAAATGTPREGFRMSFYMQDILKRYRNLKLISFGLIHGPALGGGSELAIFSDYVIVTDDVKLGFVHGKMGVSTAWGGGTRLVQKVGERKAMEILCSSKIYGAEECLRFGLADKIVSTQGKELEALSYVRQFTKYHFSITRSIKEVVRNSAEKPLEDALEIERNEFYTKWGGKLNREALSKNIKHK